MKPYIVYILFLSLLINQTAYCQDYEIDQYNGMTVLTCSGNFYDSGGNADYGINENYVVTFNSNDVINTHIQLYFNEFDIDATDTLYIYDGPNTSAPLIGKYNNNNTLFLFPVKASLTNGSGDLTIKFKSDGSGNSTGWKTMISCIPLCQLVFSHVDSLNTTPGVENNYIDVCFGDTITFVGSGEYPENNTIYEQSDATSMFIWDFGNGVTDTGQTVSYYYNYARGYDIGLTTIDSHGCTNKNALGLRVRISKSPFDHINSNPKICPGDIMTIELGYDNNSTIVVDSFGSVQAASQKFDSTMFIPDGPVCPEQCYNTEVTFNAFIPGQTITSPGDVLSICVDMEHSYVGDLEFTIVCPNGQDAILKQYVNMGNAYMGEPYGLDDHSSYDNGCNYIFNPPGTPWQYCWSEIYPNIGTINDNANQSQLDSTNTVNNTGYYLPDESFSSLIGCPLNGTWNIEICDYWQVDNGYIFEWSLNLDPDLLPTSWSYTVPITDVDYQGSFITGKTDTSITIVPDSGGVYYYYVTVTDTFGCTYDTIVAIDVYPKPKADFGNSCAMENQTIDFSDLSTINSGSVVAWQWNMGDGNNSNIKNPSNVYADDGLYNVQLIVTSDHGCMDTIIKAMDVIPIPLADINTDSSTMCFFQTAYLGLVNTNSKYTYYWLPEGQTTSSVELSGLAPGTHMFKVIITGCSVSDKDSVYINVEPCDLTIPNVITPDGNGLNDYFKIINLDKYNNSKIVIFNRWGKKVYENNNYQSNWDGGKETDGVYYYVLKTTQGIIKEYSGTITVLTK